MDTPSLRRIVQTPAPVADSFWRAIRIRPPVEPPIARLEPSRFSTYPPLRAA